MLNIQDANKYTKLNKGIQTLLNSYDYNNSDLNLIFNFGYFATVKNAIKKGRCYFDDNIVDLSYFVTDVLNLDVADNNIIINIENIYDPKYLTLDELQRIYNQLKIIKR